MPKTQRDKLNEQLKEAIDKRDSLSKFHKDYSVIVAYIKSIERDISELKS